MLKTYLIGAGALVVAFLWYGHTEYKRGYQRASNIQNERILELSKEKETIQSKIKGLQNAIKSNKDWSNTPLPSDIISVLSKD